MSLTALLIAGLAAGPGQPPGADYQAFKSRTVMLPLEWTDQLRSKVQQLVLYVSDDEGQIWAAADTVTQDKDHFRFQARADGVYWVAMQSVYRDGKKHPADMRQAGPEQKLLVDATPPKVRVTAAWRDGDEVVVEWAVDDKFPDHGKTQVFYKPLDPAGDYQPVTPPAADRRQVRFRPAGPGRVAVQVVALDRAGNEGRSAPQEVAGGVGPAGHSTPAPPPGDGHPAPPVVPPPSFGSGPPSGGGPVAPVGPVAAPVVPQDEAQAAAPQPAPPAAPPPGWPPPPGPQQPPPPPAPLAAADPGPRPMPVWNGAPPAEAPPAPAGQVVGVPRFDLQYHLDGGPSGVSRIDLYVTRDDGRSWARWSQHPGRESPLRVVLDAPGNPQVEGDYGLKLVPVSGAGLSAKPPGPGTAPDLRVHVDQTKPVITPYEPRADPGQRNTLVLLWRAQDRNLGPAPIAIEWGEQPTGPWRPVTGADAVAPAAAGLPQPAGRVANTGSFAWQLPADLPTHRVYLKFAAWDAAGNKSEVVTQSPVLVDLTVPQVRVQGIAAGPRP